MLDLLALNAMAIATITTSLFFISAIVAPAVFLGAWALSLYRDYSDDAAETAAVEAAVAAEIAAAENTLANELNRFCGRPMVPVDADIESLLAEIEIAHATSLTYLSPETPKAETKAPKAKAKPKAKTKTREFEKAPPAPPAPPAPIVLCESHESHESCEDIDLFHGLEIFFTKS